MSIFFPGLLPGCSQAVMPSWFQAKARVLFIFYMLRIMKFMLTLWNFNIIILVFTIWNLKNNICPSFYHATTKLGCQDIAKLKPSCIFVLLFKLKLLFSFYSKTNHSYAIIWVNKYQFYFFSGLLPGCSQALMPSLFHAKARVFFLLSHVNSFWNYLISFQFQYHNYCFYNMKFERQYLSKLLPCYYQAEMPRCCQAKAKLYVWCLITIQVIIFLLIKKMLCNIFL